jgi:hypothetical protein
MIFSFDLDGTLCTNHDRSIRLTQVEFEMQSPINTWPLAVIEREMATVSDDVPTPLIALVLALQVARAKLVFLTGRPGVCADATYSWFAKHGISIRSTLFIRRDAPSLAIQATTWKKTQLVRMSEQDEVTHFDDDVELLSFGRIHVVHCPWGQYVG